MHYPYPLDYHLICIHVLRKEQRTEMPEYIVKYRNERGNVSRLGPFDNIIPAGQAARLNNGRVYLIQKGREKLIPQSEVDSYIKPLPGVGAALYEMGIREYIVKRQNEMGDFVKEGPFGSLESATNYANEVGGVVYEVVPSDKVVNKKSPAKVSKKSSLIGSILKGLVIFILISIVSGFLGEIVGGFGPYSTGIWFIILLLGYWLISRRK